MRFPLVLALAWVALAGTSPAFILNESTFGDISDNGAAPTPVTFDLGVNRIGGTMGRGLPSDPVDRDIFTFTLAPGQLLTSIDVLVFEPANQSFYAIAPGNTIDVNDSATHLSNTLVKGTGEILDDLDLSAYSGGTGLDAPLGPGTYTIWFQELSAVVTYDIAYAVAVSPIPEPSTALGGAGLALVVLHGRLRRRAIAEV